MRKKVKRFKPALKCWVDKENPEELVEDKEGKYILYEDHLKIVRRMGMYMGRLKGNV